MNWLLIGVIIVLILCAMHGLYKGLVRMIFSLISIFIVFIFVSIATPYISTYIESNTSLYDTIQTKSEAYLEQTSNQSSQDLKDQIQKSMDDYEQTDTESQSATKAADVSNTTVEGSINTKEVELKIENLKLPAAIQKKIIDDTTNAASSILDESGIYKSISVSMAHIVVSGISFVIAFVVGMILINVILGLLEIIVHLPVLHGVNQLLGGVIGIIEGFLLVWVFLYIVALCTSTAFGTFMTGYIHQSAFLSYLYENNGVLQILNHFIL